MSAQPPVSAVASPVTSIETRSSWIVAFAALLVLGICYGGPVITVVGLKAIAADLGDARSVPALAYSLAWFGMAVGGLAMGPVSARIGVRWTVTFGATMICIGLYVSTLGDRWSLWIGHGLLMGLIGTAGMNAPLYIYVSNWFDRRRGTALALITSGQYIAGIIWPLLFERMIAGMGWRETMVYFGVAQLVLVLPVAHLALRHRSPVAPQGYVAPAGPRKGAPILGLSPNLLLGLLAFASFCCCVPMAMPAAHLVSFCTDLGLSPTSGAAMLSLMLLTALVSRQLWGWAADRLGGLRTVLLGSICQALATIGLMLTQNEIWLVTATAALGIGVSGIIPAYILALRQLFPASEASWRVPIFLLCSGSGMAVGGWMGGVLYDHFGYYLPAFATGVAFNIANLLVVGALVARLPTGGWRLTPRAQAA